MSNRLGARPHRSDPNARSRNVPSLPKFREQPDVSGANAVAEGGDGLQGSGVSGG
jgi:hypothetical protein